MSDGPKDDHPSAQGGLDPLSSRPPSQVHGLSPGRSDGSGVFETRNPLDHLERFRSGDKPQPRKTLSHTRQQVELVTRPSSFGDGDLELVGGDLDVGCREHQAPSRLAAGVPGVIGWFECIRRLRPELAQRMLRHERGRQKLLRQRSWYRYHGKTSILIFLFNGAICCYLVLVLALHGSNLVESIAGDNAMIFLDFTTSSQLAVVIPTALVLSFSVYEVAMMTCLWRWSVRRSTRRHDAQQRRLAGEFKFLKTYSLRRGASMRREDLASRPPRHGVASGWCRAWLGRAGHCVDSALLWYEYRFDLHGTHFALHAYASELVEFCLQMINLDRYSLAGFPQIFLLPYALAVSANLAFSPFLLHAKSSFERVVVSSVLDLCFDITYNVWPILFLLTEALEPLMPGGQCESKPKSQVCRDLEVMQSYKLFARSQEILWASDVGFKLVFRLLPCYFSILRISKLRVLRELRDPIKQLRKRHRAVLRFTRMLRDRVHRSRQFRPENGGAAPALRSPGSFSFFSPRRSIPRGSTGSVCPEGGHQRSDLDGALDKERVPSAGDSVARRTSSMPSILQKTVHRFNQATSLERAASAAVAENQVKLPAWTIALTTVVGVSFGVLCVYRLLIAQCDREWFQGCTDPCFPLLQLTREPGCHCGVYHWRGGSQGAAGAQNRSSYSDLGDQVVANVFTQHTCLNAVFIFAHGINDTGLETLWTQATFLRSIWVDITTEPSTRRRPAGNQLTRFPRAPLASQNLVTLRVEFHGLPPTNQTPALRGWPQLSRKQGNATADATAVSRVKLKELSVMGLDQSGLEWPREYGGPLGGPLDDAVELNLKRINATGALFDHLFDLQNAHMIDARWNPLIRGRLPSKVPTTLASLQVRPSPLVTGDIADLTDRRWGSIHGLSLSCMNMSGKISPGLRISPGRILQLADMRISGRLPAPLWDTDNVGHMELAYSERVSGTLPAALLSCVEIVDLRSTRISGTVSAQTIAEAPLLGSLDLRGTRVSGLFAGPRGLLGGVPAQQTASRTCPSSGRPSTYILDPVDAVPDAAPPLAALGGLRAVDLSYTRVSGRWGASGLTASNISVLLLEHTRVSGTIGGRLPSSIVSLAMGGLSGLSGRLDAALDESGEGGALAARARHLGALSFRGSTNVSGTVPLLAATDLAPRIPLQELDLSGTSVSGRLAALSLADSAQLLEGLDLSRTRVSGRLQDLVGHAPVSVEVRDLGGRSRGANDTTARPPTTPSTAASSLVPRHGHVDRIERLVLAHAGRISGTIPAAVGRLTRLHLLDMQGTAISGTLPRELGRLTRLRELFVHGASLLDVSDDALRNSGLDPGRRGCLCQWPLFTAQPPEARVFAGYSGATAEISGRWAVLGKAVGATLGRVSEPGAITAFSPYVVDCAAVPVELDPTERSLPRDNVEDWLRGTSSAMALQRSHLCPNCPPHTPFPVISHQDPDACGSHRGQGLFSKFRYHNETSTEIFAGQMAGVYGYQYSNCSAVPRRRCNWYSPKCSEYG